VAFILMINVLYYTLSLIAFLTIFIEVYNRYQSFDAEKQYGFRIFNNNQLRSSVIPKRTVSIKPLHHKTEDYIQFKIS
jgi:hypothetical protein